MFPKAYYYEFNRTYQPPGFDPNGICNPPPTPLRPNGDPDKEYFKCHAGEVTYVFGNNARDGRPDRDGKDVLFAQLVVDYWSSFARTYDPNPDTGYLKARGYTSTLDRMKKTGKWEEVKKNKLVKRRIEWNGAMEGFNEEKQCEVLGLPSSYYENI